MSVQPYESHQPDKRLSKEVQAATVRTQLDGAIQALRLTNAYKLTRMQVEMHMELGSDIAAKLTQSNNPMHRLALEQAFINWLRVSNSIVGGLW